MIIYYYILFERGDVYMNIHVTKLFVFIILGISTIVFLTGCSKDDDDYSDVFEYVWQKASNSESEPLWGYRITKYLGNEETVVIPSKINGKKVNQIGQNLLKDNNVVKEIHLPKSIISVHDTAFDGAINLEKIVVDDENENYLSYDGALYGKINDRIALIEVPQGIKGNLTIFADATEIGRRALELKNIESITFENDSKINFINPINDIIDSSIKTIYVNESQYNDFIELFSFYGETVTDMISIRN
jgi:hypothetical protein